MKSKCSIIKGDSIGGSSVIYRKNDLFIQKGLLLNSGKEIWFNNVEFENFECNLAVYDTGSKYGYIDRLGNIVIEPKYAAGSDFSEDVAFVFNDNLTILINKKGEELFTLPNIGLTHKFSEGLAKIGYFNETMEKVIYGIVNKKGNFILAPTYSKTIQNPSQLFDHFETYSNGYIRIQDNDKFAILNSKGKLITDFEYDWLSEVNEGYIAYQKDQECGFLSLPSMKRIIDPDFEDTAYYKDGIFFVKINGLWGGVDSQDRVIFNFEYESIGTFEKGLLPVMKGNKWGIVDIIGDFNIECRFDYSPDYHEGILTYIEGNKIGVMNRRFEELKSDAIFSQASMLN